MVSDTDNGTELRSDFAQQCTAVVTVDGQCGLVMAPAAVRFCARNGQLTIRMGRLTVTRMPLPAFR